MTLETTTLILIRHGNTFESHETPVQVGFKTDLPLTQQGKQQSTLLADYLKKNKIAPNAIYAGQLKRQQETADSIGKAFNLPFSFEPSLNEIDYGLWEGQTETEIKQKWVKPYQDWLEAAIWPKVIFGGSLESHLAKIKTWLEHLKREHSNQTVVGVTSNGIIRLFLYFSNLNWPELVEMRQLADYKVKTAHFCKLIINSEGVTINAWNTTPF
ncbi:MAG: histidine phosphatase family protein [Gammaproteobacteria bacterium]